MSSMQGNLDAIVALAAGWKSYHTDKGLQWYSADRPIRFAVTHCCEDWGALMKAMHVLEERHHYVFHRAGNEMIWEVGIGRESLGDYVYSDMESEAYALAKCIAHAVADLKEIYKENDADENEAPK